MSDRQTSHPCTPCHPSVVTRSRTQVSGSGKQYSSRNPLQGSKFPISTWCPSFPVSCVVKQKVDLKSSTTSDLKQHISGQSPLKLRVLCKQQVRKSPSSRVSTANLESSQKVIVDHQFSVDHLPKSGHRSSNSIYLFGTVRTPINRHLILRPKSRRPYLRGQHLEP